MSGIAWGVIGPGSIARRFAADLPASRTGRLAAVASRYRSKAEAFAAEFGVEGEAVRTYGSYEELLADPGVDAVYIATPHPFHARLSILAAEAGKHVLCEKPIAVNHADAMAVFEAAQAANVFCMEAYMYRCVPQTRAIVDLVRNGEIGEVRQIQSSFAFGGPHEGKGRNWDPNLAGGGILDVGGYPVTMARLLAGAAGAPTDAADGASYADPVGIDVAGTVGAKGVDEWAVATLTFAGGITAHLSTGIRLTAGSLLRVVGGKGFLEVENPWLPGRDGNPGGIVVHRVGREPEAIRVEETPLYAAEADAVADVIAAGGRESPYMDWGDSLGTMRVLDAWRSGIGLEFPFERLDADVPPVSGRAPVKRADSVMAYGEIPFVDKQVSRLVMGVDNQSTLPHGSVMFDDFVERGGNCFDTAYIYSGGVAERVLGQWMRNRGIRDDLVVIGKGAHTPHCDPESVTSQLYESLERLQTDHVDVYFLHRDNLDIPVGEFVDVMDSHVRAGRIRAYGGSNWSLPRVVEANAYAQKNGRQPFVALSNNFSLARMLEPVWAGCIAVSDDESREWLEREGMAVMPWSSQARGFFAGRENDPEVRRCFVDDGNLERLRRARELAKERGVDPTAIALAYVLHQEFPTFPLIGPRTLAETRSSFEALSIELTAAETRHLDLR